jgi:hypothetical protein
MGQRPLLGLRLWDHVFGNLFDGEVVQYAKCHPDRKHKARGYCGSCYVKWYVSRYDADKKDRYIKARKLQNRIRHIGAKVGRKYSDLKSEVEALIEKQKTCEICGTANDLCVDHNHVTGKVRGMLCRKHNFLIGLADEKEDILHNANRYLLRKALEADDSSV